MTGESILNNNFLGLEDEYSTFEGSRVAIVQVPYEGTVSFGKGTSRGPASIIYASRSLELFDDELGFEPCSVGIHTLGELECDIDPNQVVNAVEGLCTRLIESDKFVITLGGEHSITLGPVRAHRASGEQFSVLSIDAHADLRGEYEGTKYSHACVMRRVTEESVNVIEVGVRSYSIEESEFIKSTDKVHIIPAREINSSSGDQWIERTVKLLSNKVYISIDVDGFDSSLVPSTGTPEPGGLGWYEVLGLLKRVFAERDVIGLDIVELAPHPGVLGPDVLAAKLVYKCIGYRFNKSR